MKVDNSGIPEIDRRKQEHPGRNGDYVSPFRGITQHVEHKTNRHKKCHGKSVSHVHSSLIEPWLRLETYATMWALLVHHIKSRNFG